jgi:hypothetical protein
MRLRYNYYVQLVATRRDWMRVPNLKIWSPRQRGGWKLVVHITARGIEFDPYFAEVFCQRNFFLANPTKIITKTELMTPPPTEG